ncbi:hypothetical protein NW768_010912 [Fusarium equiseti]|uniref:Ankyrin repeat protein n=1 Tax=Fusarium equiseti TaxID=61235 RepID=A0ABQ8QZM2_FUSEQ|nr:hypothetical protein NW768_010912 [Fusarium equiseti]
MHGHEEIVKALISLPLSVFDFTRAPLENLGAISYLSRAANAQQPAIFETIAVSGKVNITERNGNGTRASIQKRDNKNRTPLFFAAMEGSQEVTRRLVGLDRVNSDAQDDDGKTPLYWATFYGHSAVAKILEDSGRVNRSIMARALEDRRASQQSEPAFTWHILQ